MDKKGVDAGKRAKMIAADDITSGSKKQQNENLWPAFFSGRDSWLCKCMLFDVLKWNLLF